MSSHCWKSSGGDLGVELDTPGVATDPVGLQTGLAAGQRGRARGKHDLIAVPLERVEARADRAEQRIGHAGGGELDAVPADLGSGRAARGGALSLGDQLGSEADAQHRRARLQRRRKEPLLGDSHG